MTPALQSMYPATYVGDIDRSRAFYGLFGFQEQRSGSAATAAWSVLRNDKYSLLLASTRPSLAVPRLPLLFYFFFTDLDAVVSGVQAAGLEVTHVGYPPHALGGEAKLLDPDGNTVLIGQRERSASQGPATDAASSSFSLLTEAAALVAARGGTTASCQVRNAGGAACGKQAEVKLADSGGDTAWACLGHADEILVAVSGAFIASEGEPGIAGFMSRRSG